MMVRLLLLLLLYHRFYFCVVFFSSSSSFSSSLVGAFPSMASPPKRKLALLQEDHIVWPPTVIIENTRLSKSSDGRWTGIGNSEMAVFLSGIGHTLGRPKSSWGREGHRGQVLVRYPPTLEGLREAERLHAHFKAYDRGRDEWLRVKPLWHGLPGHEGIEEGPDFKRIDDETKEEKRVFYGYLAVVNDLDKFPPPKKKHKKCKTVSKKEIEAKAAANSQGVIAV